MHEQTVSPQSVSETPRCSSTPAGIASLLVISFLCLPSLIGASALFLERALHRDISQWNDTAAALIALGSIIGGPLVAIAAVVGAGVSLSRAPVALKRIDLVIVAVAALASLLLLIRFAK